MAKKKKEEEKKFALISGELVEIEEFDIPQQTFKTNEPLDRSCITDDTKKELAVLLKKLPEIKPVIEILIGKSATQELK